MPKRDLNKFLDFKPTVSNKSVTNNLRKTGYIQKKFVFALIVITLLAGIVYFTFSFFSYNPKVKYSSINIFIEEEYQEAFLFLTDIKHEGKNRFTIVDNPKKADVIIKVEKEVPEGKEIEEKAKILVYDLLPTVKFTAPIISIEDRETLKFTIKTDNPFASYILKKLYGVEALTVNKENRNDFVEDKILLVPLSELTPQLRVITKDGYFALDQIRKGSKTLEGGFRTVVVLTQPTRLFNKPDKEALGITAQILKNRLNMLEWETSQNIPISKITITGVTAITRGLLKKLDSTKDYGWLIENIKDIVKDADIVHTSNEVSFVPNCSSYSGMRFCSKPKYLQILKELNINLVELTGNHNNDFGSKWNRYTIEKLYLPNNINYFGGGINQDDAKKPYVATLPNGTKVAFLGYNYYDTLISKNQTPLAGKDKAGANPYIEEKVKNDIKSLKNNVDFIFVHIQFQECYAYPPQRDIRYPVCYYPLKSQEKVFKRLIDYGASFVIGTQAHQPQQLKFYKNGFIAYGLGNFLFDQIQWIGTREGIILSFYFTPSKLIQIRIIPTWQEKDYSIRLMKPEEAFSLLKYLF